MPFIDSGRLIRRRGDRSLRLRAPDVQLLVMVVSILATYIVVTELVVRMFDTSFYLGFPSVGSSSKEFEARLSEFETFATARDTIDCVILGDSTVMTNFVPQAFGDSFRRQTGKSIDCFNFGAGAFTTADLAALAKIVVQEHPPQLLIVGIEALNFAVPTGASRGVDLTELSWTHYRLGHFTLEGWLYEHSALYRHLDTISGLVALRITLSEVRGNWAETMSKMSSGFYPLEGPGPFDVSDPPDPNSDHPYHENYFGSLSEFKMLSEHVAALHKIVALNSSTTQVVILEMPVPPTFMDYFGNGEEDYGRFVETVEQSVSGTTVPFRRTSELELLPSELWFNYNHLNSAGAPIFSEWLGSAIGQEVVAGTLVFSPQVTGLYGSR